MVQRQYSTVQHRCVVIQTVTKGQQHPDGGKPPPHLVVSSCQSYRKTHLVDAMSIVLEVPWEVCIVVSVFPFLSKNLYI